MRFAVEDDARFDDSRLDRVCICGQDELPYRGRAYFADGELIIERQESDSGVVFVPWYTDTHGEVTLCSGTLMERGRPYQLEVELARGMLFRLRNQLSIWQQLGLAIPDDLQELTRKATRNFAQAATNQQEPESSSRSAVDAIHRTLQATDLLIDNYSQQVLAARRGQNAKLPTLLGCNLGKLLPEASVESQIKKAFNMVALPVDWRSIEQVEGQRDWSSLDAQVDWAVKSGLKVCSGPILQFDDGAIPEWAYLFEGNLPVLRSFMLDHVRQTVLRYQGKIGIWQISSRVCGPPVLGMDEEQRLNLVADAIREVRKMESRVPIVVTFNEPWAESFAHNNLEIPPLHFADALVRHDLGLSGLGVEINVGYWPRGSAQRTPLAVSRLIDYWSLFEMPLIVKLVFPSSQQPDQLADGRIQVQPIGVPEFDASTQANWLARYVPMLLAKNAVQVVLYNQLADSVPHEFPHGGLLNVAGEAKPACETLATIRAEHLQ